jgi:predicted phage-related endonuclease
MMEVHRRAVTTRAEWLDWRRAYLCASELGAVCGLDDYRTPLSVYCDKAGLIMSQPDSPIMRRGRNFERAVLTYISEDYPDWRVEQPNVFLFENTHRLGATPDAIVERPDYAGIVNCQIKTIALPSFENWEGTPPVSYTLQVACENMLLNADHGILAVLAVGNYSADLHVFDIPRHAGAEARICEIADQFWQDMAAGRVPAANYKQDAETIASLYPEATSESIDLSTDNRLGEALEERELLKLNVADMMEEISALDAEIKHKIGEHAQALFPGWKITLKTQTRKSYQVPEWSGRVLRVSRAKEK